MLLNQPEFKVDVWNAEGIYAQLMASKNPNTQRMPTFTIGFLDIQSEEISTGNLFKEIVLTTHTEPNSEPNNPDLYYVRCRAIYQDKQDVIRRDVEIESLRDLIKATRNGYKPELTYYEKRHLMPTIPGIDIPDDIQKYMIRTERIIDSGERAFEIFIIGEPTGLLSVDDHKGRFLRRAYGWGRVLEDVVKAIVELKQKEQKGILRVGLTTKTSPL